MIAAARINIKLKHDRKCLEFSMLKAVLGFECWVLDYF